MLLKFFKTLKELLQQSGIHLFLAHLYLFFFFLAPRFDTLLFVLHVAGAAAYVKTSSVRPSVAAEEAACDLINSLQ